MTSSPKTMSKLGDSEAEIPLGDGFKHMLGVNGYDEGAESHEMKEVQENSSDGNSSPTLLVDDQAQQHSSTHQHSNVSQDSIPLEGPPRYIGGWRLVILLIAYVLLLRQNYTELSCPAVRRFRFSFPTLKSLLSVRRW